MTSSGIFLPEVLRLEVAAMIISALPFGVQPACPQVHCTYQNMTQPVLTAEHRRKTPSGYPITQLCLHLT